MAEATIAARFRRTCDACKTEVESERSGRPAHWSNLHVLRDAYDFQGAAVADASVKLDLCTQCTTVVVAAVNAAIDERRAAIAKATGAA